MGSLSEVDALYQARAPRMVLQKGRTYLKRLYNESTNAGSAHFTLAYCVCLPSIQKGAYIVTALHEDDGVLAEAHCQCVAG